jgi:putative transposase
MIAFIDNHRQTYGVEPICRVCRSPHRLINDHGAKRHDPSRESAQAKRDKLLKIEIQRVFEQNFSVYGVGKVWRQLKREGFALARCTVERLMRALGLQGVVRGRKIRTTIRQKEQTPCPLERVQRQSQAVGPNALWVPDFTYIPTWAGFVYFVVWVIGSFARCIVGWRVSQARRQPWCSTRQEVVKGIKTSLSLPGRCTDRPHGNRGVFHRPGLIRSSVARLLVS